MALGGGWEGRDDYTEEEAEILRAALTYREEKGLRFLSVLDMVEVLKRLGYERRDREKE